MIWYEGLTGTNAATCLAPSRIMFDVYACHCRHQAAAVGSHIYIHHHRSTQDITVLDVTSPDRPKLSKVAAVGLLKSLQILHIVWPIGTESGEPTAYLFLCRVPFQSGRCAGHICDQKIAEQLMFPPLDLQGVLCWAVDHVQV